jgi:ribosome-associated protein
MKHEFELQSEYIELIKLIKLLGIAETGGQAKMMVDNGEIIRNGRPEYRKRAKIISGDELQFPNGDRIKITGKVQAP